MARDNKKSKHIGKPSTSKKGLLASESKPHLDIKKIWLLCTVIIATIAVVIFIIIAPSFYKTESSSQKDTWYDNSGKSKEELLIEDLLGVESTLSETSNLDSEKVVLGGIHESYSGEKDCKGEVFENSKKTFFDSENNFNVVEHEISLKAGIRDDDWKKYTIQSDGLLLKDSYDGKKKKSGKDTWDKLNVTSSHYSRFIEYGVLDIQCSIEFQYDYPGEEKGYVEEVDEEDDNLLYTIFGTWSFRWGVYASGSLTTDSDTIIVVIGKDSELNNDASVNALSDSYIDENPYPNLAENISPISEIHIFNFDFSIDEETKEFVNKWSYAVSKNTKH